MLAVELAQADDPAPQLRAHLDDGRTLALACPRPKREYCRGTGEAAEHEWVLAGDHLWAICGRQVRALSLLDGSAHDVFAAPGEISDVATLIADARGTRFALTFVGPARIAAPGTRSALSIFADVEAPALEPGDEQRLAELHAKSEAAALEPRVVVFDDRGHQLWSSLEHGGETVLSADGRWLAHADGDTIAVVEVDTGRQRTINRAGKHLWFWGNDELLWTGGDRERATIERLRLSGDDAELLLDVPRTR